MNPETLLKVSGLRKTFQVSAGLFSFKKHEVQAVNGVSFEVNKGEALGIVGESGCGKTTLGRVILRLIEPTSGEIYFMGEDFLKLEGHELRKKRGLMQIIFQDSYASLDPRMTVGDLIGEPLDIQKAYPTKKERDGRILELMDIVGLGKDYIRRYAHEFSGGQRQRIGIARALALKPKLIVCDEPVSALDVSIQAQILNLMEEIQKSLGVSYIFISHDLSVVKYVSDNVAVMYLGKIVEIAPRNKLYDSSKHPYTNVLLSAIPIPDTRVKRKKLKFEGEVPSPIDLPSGCCFRTRCPHATQVCIDEVPGLTDLGDGHFVACNQISG